MKDSYTYYELIKIINMTVEELKEKYNFIYKIIILHIILNIIFIIIFLIDRIFIITT